MGRGGMQIAFAGGIPASLGGGGLELQMERTAGALAGLGHGVFHVAREADARPFDVLHLFGTEPDAWHLLRHWRRNPAPLVVSPVLVAAPARERALRRASRIPVADFGPRMRVEILRRAQAVIALTESEARLLRRLGGESMAPVTVLPNGVDVDVASEAPVDGTFPEPYALLLGTVSRRKRQQEAVEALGAAGVFTVVAGGFEGSAAERSRFETAIGAAGARWLGEVSPAQARYLVRRARALVHLSEAEGQSLAVLEALAVGTPVVASPLPANRELAAAHPGSLRLADSESAAAEAIGSVPDRCPPVPFPTWSEIAGRLEAVYRSVTASSGGS